VLLARPPSPPVHWAGTTGSAGGGVSAAGSAADYCHKAPLARAAGQLSSARLIGATRGSPRGSWRPGRRGRGGQVRVGGGGMGSPGAVCPVEEEQ